MVNISSDAIVGVAGTLLGTVLGWILGMLSNMGRLIISVKDVSINFTGRNPQQEYIKLSSAENIDIVTIMFTMNIFNRKNKPLSMSECEIILQYQDEKVMIGEDIFTDRESIDELDKLFNLDSFSAKTISYNKTYTLLPHTEKLRRGYRVYLQYRLNGGYIVHKQLIAKHK